MREKLNTLPLSELKELAKAQGLKGFSSLRKAELIDLLCQSAEKEEQPIQPGKEQTVEQTAPPLSESIAVQQIDEMRNTGQKTIVPKTDKQRMDTQQMEPQQPEIRKDTGKDNFRSERNERSDRNERSTERNDGNRTNRNRADGKGNRTITRFDNRGGYQSRGRNQDNGRGQDNIRNQDNSRNQDTASSQDYMRNQENGRNQESGRNQDNSRNQESGRGQDNDRNQETGRNQEMMQNQDNGRMQEYTRSQDIRPVDINQEEILDLDSGMEANGILEVMPDGFGFIRCENFLPGDNDVYVAPSQIRRFNMKTGDIIRGNRRVKSATEKFAALLYVTSINGYPVGVAEKRPNFDDLTPIFPNERIHMETYGKSTMAMRVLDLMAPIGKGQRGMIVSPPKAGKTTLLKQVAKAITANQPSMHLIILLIDERPEEVTDIKEAIVGNNVEVIYSTFDELPERHKRVSEMVIERARRLVEHGRDVTILLDSITRLARAYNLVVPPSGRTLSGGLDPSALHMPKRFFGAARNMREGGSLTILATALIDTGSRMDDVIYEEFKGTGNMELVLDRKLSERRIFPAIDILKSGTRRDDLLLSREEAEAMEIIRRATNAMKPEESVEKLMDLFAKTRNNQELVAEIRRRRYI
ncbi:MAG: transcription termination factor Rho [Lachnospiraceae bacterium]|nr:transcription termination factor Rho [Lachnospiraceae bacterium]